MRSRILSAAIVLAVVAAVAPLAAHHSWPVDFSREVTVKGTVTSYSWANPHVMIGLDVADSSGKIEKWQVGGPSTSRMESTGWDKTTLKPGDVITGTGYRFSDGQRVLRLQRATMPDGSVKLLYGK